MSDPDDGAESDGAESIEPAAIEAQIGDSQTPPAFDDWGASDVLTHGYPSGGVEFKYVRGD